MVDHRAGNRKLFGINSDGNLIFLELPPSGCEAVHLLLEEIRYAKTRESGEWTLMGTGFRKGDGIDGWRVTGVNRATHQTLEYWVQNGRLFHVQSGAGPQDHYAQFVIGQPVKRVDPSVKAVILDTVEIWSSGGTSI
jgi:hypothetical protein